MTSRPVFIPIIGKKPGVDTVHREFKWFPGVAKVQKQRTIHALHETIAIANPQSHPLEVSSKSTEALGVSLSAFNLKCKGIRSGKSMTVESIFQASKIFDGDEGPHPEWYILSPMEVREKVKDFSGKALTGFGYAEEIWPLTPSRLFYDWIYCKILHLNQNLVDALEEYDCFTDIEFNPTRSINCQAYALALYLSLKRNGVLTEALANRENFLKFHPQEVITLKASNVIPKAKKTAPKSKRSKKAPKQTAFTEVGLYPELEVPKGKKKAK